MKRPSWLQALCFHLMLFHAAPYSVASEIHLSTNPLCTHELSGEIKQGDLESIKRIPAAQMRSICLSSPGGSFNEAVLVAKYLDGRGISTVVPKGAACFSSCAIIFMSGSEEVEGVHFPRRKMSVSGHVGFHAPYVTPKDGVYSQDTVRAAFQVGLTAVAEMLEIGRGIDDRGAIPQRFVVELLKKGPNEMLLVDTAVRAFELGIDLFDAPTPQWDQQAACNACNVRNRVTWDTPQCRTGQQRKLSSNIVEYTFIGYGAEGSYDCKVRVDSGARPVKAGIVPLVTGDGPPAISEYVALRNSDALGTRLLDR